MKTKNQYRQGDVIIERVVVVPEGAEQQKPRHRIVLAQGEATGHHHCLEAERDPADYWKLGQEQFVRIGRRAMVTHQEHAPIDLPAGTYRVRRQREYSPEAIRNVAD